MSGTQSVRDTTGNRAVGTARSDTERSVETALAAIQPWHGRRLEYAPVLGGLQNSNWRITVEGTDTRYFLKIPGAGSETFIDRALAWPGHGR